MGTQRHQAYVDRSLLKLSALLLCFLFSALLRSMQTLALKSRMSSRRKAGLKPIWAIWGCLFWAHAEAQRCGKRFLGSLVI